MNHATLHSPGPVLLAGGGDHSPDLLQSLLPQCTTRIAADGGAAALLSAGVMPDAVIGDLDSLSENTRAQIPAARIHHISEQDSTDFDKCLRNISAPLIYGTGFLGPRIDHQLASLSVLTRRADRRCILADASDAVALVPPQLELDLAPGNRVSLYPMGPVRGESEGLRWPLAGLDFAPHLRTGTSNEASAARVTLRFDTPLMLIILPVAALPALARGLLSAPDAWPAPE
ncbi:thiamine diphosphokinase [Salipiger abyssi]|uniref:thiamine diphosphokinase n=1 Tax=Salipiger abyssi TaxID=1250539 RepID=UPI001A8DFE7A|nr:thiamine diphosphokinase [Salipiger abyssi]MBN9886768.1 thiamine diphosphokinase [Salipiger abyssi]